MPVFPWCHVAGMNVEVVVPTVARSFTINWSTNKFFFAFLDLGVLAVDVDDGFFFFVFSEEALDVDDLDVDDLVVDVDFLVVDDDDLVVFFLVPEVVAVIIIGAIKRLIVWTGTIASDVTPDSSSTNKTSTTIFIVPLSGVGSV